MMNKIGNLLFCVVYTENSITPGSLLMGRIKEILTGYRSCLPRMSSFRSLTIRPPWSLFVFNLILFLLSVVLYYIYTMRYYCRLLA